MCSRFPISECIICKYRDQTKLEYGVTSDHRPLLVALEQNMSQIIEIASEKWIEDRNNSVPRAMAIYQQLWLAPNSARDQLTLHLADLNASANTLYSSAAQSLVELCRTGCKDQMDAHIRIGCVLGNISGLEVMFRDEFTQSIIDAIRIEAVNGAWTPKTKRDSDEEMQVVSWEDFYPRKAALLI
jgi:hypothetical protein